MDGIEKLANALRTWNTMPVESSDGSVGGVAWPVEW
jgi:hypothetical protein